MFRFLWVTAALSAVAFAIVGASPASEPDSSGAPPARIDFPTGWAAEGVWIAHDGTFYAGDTTNGNIYKGDVRSGTGSVLVDNLALGRTGRSAFGVFVDRRNRIFVAGGRTCHALVYDATTGAQIADVMLTTPPCFVNDVTVTRTGAYFTNTNNATSGESVLFHIPIGKHGELGTPEKLPVPFIGGNGIEATRDGETLVVASIYLNKIYTFDVGTGVTAEIVTNEPVYRGDGLILKGRTLYAAENLPSPAVPGRSGDIAVVQLAEDFHSGTVVAHLNSTDDPLVNPATMDPYRHWIYVVRRNAPAPAPAAYHLTRVTNPQTDEEGGDGNGGGGNGSD